MRQADGLVAPVVRSSFVSFRSYPIVLYARICSFGGGNGACDGVLSVIRPGTAAKMGCRLGKEIAHLELCRASHHLLESDTDAFNNCEKDGAANGAVSSGLVTSTDRQTASLNN